MASFDIVVQTSGSLHPDREPDDYISTYAGFVRCIWLFARTLFRRMLASPDG